MATKQFYFSGLIKWAKRQKDDRFDNWTVNLYPDEKSLESIKASGVQIRPKKDDDGTFFTFRRPSQKEIKGEIVNFGPPEFKIEENGEAVNFDGIVGNGSKGVVKVSVFDVPRTGGKGHRYESLLVQELVKYETTETPSAKPAIPF